MFVILSFSKIIFLVSTSNLFVILQNDDMHHRTIIATDALIWFSNLPLNLKWILKTYIQVLKMLNVMTFKILLNNYIYPFQDIYKFQSLCLLLLPHAIERRLIQEQTHKTLNLGAYPELALLQYSALSKGIFATE